MNELKFETRDIWIASALHSLGYQATAEKIGEKQFIFIFNCETPEEFGLLNEALNRYGRWTLPVDVATLQKSYKILKNLTFGH